jgi:putative hemolysin
VVLDEYGGVDGIATVEDLAEELFGEIEDEYDRPQFRYRRVSPTSYIISGRAEIDILNREIDLKMEKIEGVETIGGWLITRIGRIPQEKEKFQIAGLELEVLLADVRRVKMLKVKKEAMIGTRF